MNMRTQVQKDATPQDEPSLRDQLEAAYEEHEDAPDTPSDEPAETAAATTVADAPAEPSPTPTAAPAPVSGTPADPAPQPPSETHQPQAEDPYAKAPGTWTPEAREKWGTVDPSIRSEIWKREKEASRAMTISTNARKFEQEFSQAAQPYLGFIAAEGATPLQAAQQMWRNEAILRAGSPQQKVELIADAIKRYGIDLGALDSVLAGQSPEFNPQANVAHLVNQQVQQAIQGFQQQQAQQQSQRTQQEVVQELEAFANDPKNEFFNDVRSLMGDIIELADRQGQQMGLREAYERATLLHEPVRRVIEGRKAVEQARQTNAAAQRSKAASKGVVSSPAAAQGGQNAPADDSIRAALEFAFTQQQGAR